MGRVTYKKNNMETTHEMLENNNENELFRKDLEAGKTIRVRLEIITK